MAISSLVARSLCRAAMPALFRQGYSANKAIEFFKRTIGQAYQKQLFLDDWREIGGVEKIKESFRFIPRKYRFSYNLAVPRAGQMSTNYQYLFKVFGTDPKTGKDTYMWTSLLDDVRLDPDLATDIMHEQLEDPAIRTDPSEWMKDWQVELYVIYRSREVIYRR